MYVFRVNFPPFWSYESHCSVVNWHKTCWHRYSLGSREFLVSFGDSGCLAQLDWHEVARFGRETHLGPQSAHLGPTRKLAVVALLVDSLSATRLASMASLALIATISEPDGGIRRTDTCVWVTFSIAETI